MSERNQAYTGEPSHKDPTATFAVRNVDREARNHHRERRVRKRRIILEYPENGFLTEEEYRVGASLLIPRFFLHGIQPKEAYDERKERAVKNQIKVHGMDFLLQNPSFICAIPGGDTMVLAIIDGHHKARFSGKRIVDGREVGTDRIPCMIFTVSQTAEIFRKRNVLLDGKEVEDQFLEEWLKQGMMEAIGSFNATMPMGKQPKSVPNVHSIDDLKARFKSFDVLSNRSRVSPAGDNYVYV